jgi:hypothetical protein
MRSSTACGANGINKGMVHCVVHADIKNGLANCVRREWHPERKVHPASSERTDQMDRSSWREDAQWPAVIFCYLHVEFVPGSLDPERQCQKIPAHHEVP